MNRIISYLVAALAFVAAFAGTAFAQSAAAEASWMDLAQPAIQAFMSGQPALACALALVTAVALARAFAPASWKLNTDIGGTALTFLGSLGAACAAALTAGSLPSWGLLWTALGIAAGASGGYTAVRRLVAPALRWVESKVPAKIRPAVTIVFNLVLYFFEKRPGAIAKAEAAGAAAVEAAPAKGVESVAKIGKSFP
jgi:hypothetical protein